MYKNWEHYLNNNDQTATIVFGIIIILILAFMLINETNHEELI